MEPLIYHDISKEILELEFDDNTTCLNRIKDLSNEATTNEASYIELYTALIQMEEAATRKQIAAYDLDNVKPALVNRLDKTFRIIIDVS